MDPPEVMRNISYDSLQKMEYERSQVWSSMFLSIENIKEENEIEISQLHEVIDKTTVSEKLSSCDEAEEFSDEEITTKQLEILQDITNYKPGNDLSMQMLSFASNHEDSIATNDIMDAINQTLPIVEEHRRKCKESGIDNVLNTFDAKKIKKKVGCLFKKEAKTKISAKCQREKTNELQKHEKKQKPHKWEYDDSSSDADSMHSMETARYVLSSRKKLSNANAVKEKMTIKSYCKLKSQRDLLHKKYAIDEEGPYCFEPRDLEKSPICTKRHTESKINRLTQSERRPKLFRKRRPNGGGTDVSLSSDDEECLGDLKNVKKNKCGRVCNCANCKKIMKLCLTHECNNYSHSPSTSPATECYKNICHKNKHLECDDLPQKNRVTKTATAKKIENPKQNFVKKHNAITNYKKEKKSKSIGQSEKVVEIKKQNKQKKLEKQSNNYTNVDDTNADDTNVDDTNADDTNVDDTNADDTFIWELQMAIQNSKKTYKDEIMNKYKENDQLNETLNAIESSKQQDDVQQNANESASIDINETDNSIERTLRPQPKSKKLRQLQKIRNMQQNKNPSEQTFFGNTANICNSTAFEDNYKASENQMTAEIQNVYKTPVKIFNKNQTPGINAARGQPLTPFLETIEENDCNLVTSTTTIIAIDENQNLPHKNAVLLYTPKDKASLLSPKSQNSGYFHITQEHLSGLLGEKKAKKFFKYHVGRRCFNINSTVYYCPPEGALNSSANTDSDDDELENFGKYGDLYETTEIFEQ